MTADAAPSPDTRIRLIEVAERLFAEHGVASVSLRTVGATAGQRNNSVTQYHFGSKDGLIAAIARHRSAPISERRMEMVAELRAADGPPSVESLIRLLVVPLAESMAGSRRETWYLRFLASALDHPLMRDLDEPGGPEHPGIAYMLEELRLRLPGTPAAVFERRTRWMAAIVVRVLADHERQLASSEGSAVPLDEVVSDLVVSMAALLRAPRPPRSPAGAPPDAIPSQ
ncbi:TetR/AcrR family transcriptional regulator [Microtetraspora niveoalba]|uniref:TetR/AcrR family transcriptional regulator n=1 Tax=Microtetraspora niveoalba TaxID=46175 RepID=UPI00082B2EFF|nr:TetR/AcrR family transcriptional regulator [Microtetraspora niveoalba]